MRKFVIVLLIVCTVACTVSGNLILKSGAGQPGWVKTWPFSIINLRVILGIVFFALGLVCYTTVLRVIPLNVAQAIFSVQFVLVIVASSLFLGEPVGVVRWAGIGLIACGLFIVGWSVSAQ